MPTGPQKLYSAAEAVMSISALLLIAWARGPLLSGRD